MGKVINTQKFQIVISDIPRTVGSDFGSKIVTTSDGKRIKMNIWDIAGQEKYQHIEGNYFQGALGCVVVYDITKY